MNKIYKLSCDLKRQKLMKKITGNLGSVFENDERIFCYVSSFNSHKLFNGNFIRCNGISESDKDLVQKYNLNKTICYVFDSINFGNKRVNIYGSIPCEVILKQCKSKALTITISGKCIIENVNIIKPHNSIIIAADEIEINNSRIRNYYSLKSQNMDILLIARNNLSINNSYVGKKYEKTILRLYSSNEFIINNSIVSADKIKIKSPIVREKGYSEINAEKLWIDVKEMESINILSDEITIKKLDNSITKTLKK